MKSLRNVAFIVIVILQIAVLCVMIVKRVHLLDTGVKVLLKCEPIDPRSLINGDYVFLNYQISSLTKDLYTGMNLKNLKSNDTVYVAIDKPANGKYWVAKSFSSDFETLNKEYPVVMSGTIKDTYLAFRIHYGVENYFVPQNQGLQIEQKMGDVSVEVSVSDTGENAISRLFINDREVTFY